MAYLQALCRANPNVQSELQQCIGRSPSYRCGPRRDSWTSRSCMIGACVAGTAKSDPDRSGRSGGRHSEHVRGWAETGLLRRKPSTARLETGKGAQALDRRPEPAGAMKHARKLAKVRAGPALEGSLEQPPGHPEKIPDDDVGTPILRMGRVCVGRGRPLSGCCGTPSGWAGRTRITAWQLKFAVTSG